MPFWGLGLFVLEMIYGIHFGPAVLVIEKSFALDSIHKVDVCIIATFDISIKILLNSCFDILKKIPKPRNQTSIKRDNV